MNIKNKIHLYNIIIKKINIIIKLYNIIIKYDINNIDLSNIIIIKYY